MRSILIVAVLAVISPALAMGAVPEEKAFHHAQARRVWPDTNSQKPAPANNKPAVTPAPAPSTNACDPQTLFNNPTIVNFLTKLKACGVDDINAVIADANKQTPPDYIALGCMTPLLPLVTAVNSGGILMEFQAFRDARKSSLLTNCASWVNSTLAPIQ